MNLNYKKNKINPKGFITYYVNFNDGFGNSDRYYGSKSSIKASFEYADFIDAGMGGVQDYPLPEWAEYWDEVGYSYLSMESKWTPYRNRKGGKRKR